MNKSKSTKTVKKNIETPSCSIMPWAYEHELQQKIEREAYLRAEKDGFRNTAEFYWLSAEIDYGCALP